MLKKGGYGSHLLTLFFNIATQRRNGERRREEDTMEEGDGKEERRNGFVFDPLVEK